MGRFPCCHMSTVDITKLKKHLSMYNLLNSLHLPGRIIGYWYKFNWLVRLEPQQIISINVLTIFHIYSRPYSMQPHCIKSISQLSFRYLFSISFNSLRTTRTYIRRFVKHPCNDFVCYRASVFYEKIVLLGVVFK